MSESVAIDGSQNWLLAAGTVSTVDFEAGDRYVSDRYQGAGPDEPATAVMQDGLRCRAERPDGKYLHTDMSQAFGGRGEIDSPGRLMRAALASCDATGLQLPAT